jgi:hypothetical protein
LKGRIVEVSDFKRVPKKKPTFIVVHETGHNWKFLVFERRVSGFWMDSDKA